MNPILTLQPLSISGGAVQDGIAKIMARVERDENGCFVWQGGRQSKGYGCVNFEGRSWLVHRFMYEAINGSIPTGYHIDHVCRNRACCNPDHLEAVTPRENIQRVVDLITHCPQGHEYTPENTKVTKRRRGTSRSCRACEADWQRNHRVRKPVAKKSPALYGESHV